MFPQPLNNGNELADDSHSLLEVRVPNYSETTLRRAYIVWNSLGQRNSFQQVCNFYHRLEAHEATLTPEQREESQMLDLRLAVEGPPTSPYLLENYPYLYPQLQVPSVEEKPLDPLIALFQLKNEILTSDIINSSLQIQKFCKLSKRNMQTFIEEFKHFCNKCGLDQNLMNVKMYMSKQQVTEDLYLAAQLGKVKGALNDFID